MANIKAKFSKQTGGIYPTDVYAEFPNDALDIPNAIYAKYQKGELSGFDVEAGEVVGNKPLLSNPRESMEVTAFQAKAAIARSGLYENVEALMTNENTPFEVKLAWQEVLTFKRLSPTVLTMGAALGFNDAQLDDLFTLAATIEA